MVLHFVDQEEMDKDDMNVKPSQAGQTDILHDDITNDVEDDGINKEGDAKLQVDEEKAFMENYDGYKEETAVSADICFIH